MDTSAHVHIATQSPADASSCAPPRHSAASDGILAATVPPGAAASTVASARTSPPRRRPAGWRHQDDAMRQDDAMPQGRLAVSHPPPASVSVHSSPPA